MKSQTLKLAKDLTFPVDAVTQTFLVVGKRGSGKSNTAARFVEQLHHAGVPFVVLDPVDTWWGLKAGREGGRGLGVYVFGGRKADLPLEAGGGALIAEVLCEHRMSMVLSVKHLSGGERSRFMVAFAQTLFQKWGGGPLHVVLEEAHELAPQMAGGRSQSNDGEAAMLGAFKRLWKLGRSSGIGGTAVTQRPASLSKDITTQSEILIAHRTIGPQDVKAVGEWVKYHGEHLDMLAELPSLPTGEAFVWAPEFPEGQPLGLKRTAILLRETYDSASTPKVGEQRVEPKELAAVDLERLRTKMAATIEKAKTEDPKELRKALAEANRELAHIRILNSKLDNRTAPAAPPKSEPVLTEAELELLRLTKTAMEDMRHALNGVVSETLKNVAETAKVTIDDTLSWFLSESEKARESFAARFEKARVQKILDKIDAVQAAPQKQPTMRPTPSRPLPAAQPGRASVATRPAARGADAEVALPPGEHATLTAALQYPDGLDRKRLGILTGYKRSSRDAYIARLTQKGLVEVQGAYLFATDAGRAQLNGSFEPLPTGAELVEYWRQRLPEGERATLEVLLKKPGANVARETIDNETGYKRSSRDAYLTRLKARGLVEFVARGEVKASEELFS